MLIFSETKFNAANRMEWNLLHMVSLSHSSVVLFSCLRLQFSSLELKRMQQPTNF